MRVFRCYGWGRAVAALAVFALPVRVLGGEMHGSGAVSISGYGEMHYSRMSDGDAELDFHRLVVGFGTQLADRIGFHAELDFEHAFTEPELEFAYLDFFYRDALSFRTGVVLMPVGPLNEFHEPPLFYSVERPYVQKHVIPSTWQEPGVGVVGALADGSVGYRAYVVGGLDASGFDGASGIRGGRQSGAEAKAADLAGVARVEYAPTLNASVGVSGYVGGASHGKRSLGDAMVSIAEADGRLRLSGVEVSAVWAAVFIGDADSISVHNESVVAERIVGFYAEAAFHLLRLMGRSDARDLVAFGRYESFDTNDRVAGGYVRNAAYEREVVTLGLSFMPVPNVALKADVELWETGDGAEWEQFNLGVGFMY